MDNTEKATDMRPVDLEEMKECTRPSARDGEMELADPRKDGAVHRPLIRRQYAAGIPLNDPNSVF
jgi:hypothetical protein